MYTPEEIESFNWTPAKLEELELECDEHLASCDECHELWLPYADSDLPKDFEWCPVGESLTETLIEAICQFSWQPNFTQLMEELEELEGLEDDEPTDGE